MPPEHHPGADKQTRTRKIIILALLVLALGTVFLLPNFVSEPWIAGESAEQPAVADASPSYVSPSTAAEKTRFRQESQRVLAEIIAARGRLLERQVEAWAEIRFRQALQKIDQGDEQYSYGEYEASLASYEQALRELADLEAVGRETLEAALADGTAAIEALNTVVASDASELATLIEPENDEVRALATRVEKLPQVSALLESGDQARAAGQLTVARDAYQEAVALDPKHGRAAASLAAVRAEITEQAFRRHMSRGFAALDNSDFEQAREAFGQAGQIYPGNDAVAKALAQVENRASQMSVNRSIARAAELEAAEDWHQAVAVYESLLASDPTLTEARVKLIPAKVRADLDARLDEFLDDPLRLSDTTVHQAAQKTLADARGISNPGVRLGDQVARLERLLERALVPVDVTFQSDNLTHVTLFRVAELGRFERTSLRLMPGRYVAAGTRQGYRDVRVEFTISGEPRTEPIVVRCMEPI